MIDQLTQTNASAAPEWAPVLEAIEKPQIRTLVPTYSSFNNLLRKNRRRMIEQGAIIKAGKCWAVSLSRAPGVIEQIYREQTLAAIDRAS